MLRLGVLVGAWGSAEEEEVEWAVVVESSARGEERWS